MALFVDGDISTIADLQIYDSAVLGVSDAGGVNLGDKLIVAKTEIGIALQEFLEKRMGGASQDVLVHVVVTPALKQWHTTYALSLVYADVVNNQVTARYEARWKEYKARTKSAAARLFQLGVGLVDAPLRRAAAPIVRELGGPLAPETYMVHVAWSNGRGETGAASDPVAVMLESGGGFGVRLSTGVSGVAGFDVYVGEIDGAPTRQTQSMVGVGSEWVVPQSGLVNGGPISTGQTPDWFVRNERVLQRG